MTGPAGSFVVPPGTDVREATRRLAPATPAEEAVVLVRPGAAAVLRRTATAVEPDVDGPDEQTPWDRLRLLGAPRPTSCSPSAPTSTSRARPALRDEVVSRLRAAVGAAS